MTPTTIYRAGVNVLIAYAMLCDGASYYFQSSVGKGLGWLAIIAAVSALAFSLAGPPPPPKRKWPP